MPDNHDKTLNCQAAGIRVLWAILLPLAAALAAGFLLTNVIDVGSLNSQVVSAVLLSCIVMVSWVLGLRWYGISGLGLRGGRPLYAGIGFAVLAWVILLIARFIFVDILILGSPNAGRTYIYLLLFEAFASQIWTFGLLFRAISDWRGPLTAAISSGILFGLLAILLFQEAFEGTQISFLFFISWGVLYGLIRLRTGSLLGMVIVQSLQSFSIWVALSPFPSPDPGQIRNMYVTAAIAYAIVIWRLWPNQEEDYRI